MSILSIRDACEADKSAVAAILSGWIDTTDWMPRLHTLDEDRAFVARLIQRGGVRVAEVGSRIEGFISPKGEEIEALYVSDTGQGIGSALLGGLKEKSDRLSLRTSAANEDTRRFYAKHGFAEVGSTDGDNDEGLPDVKLSWEAVADV